MDADALKPIEWEGDIEDDCTARWNGMLGRCEALSDDLWYAAVYDLATKDEIWHNATEGVHPSNGDASRTLCEHIMRSTAILRSKWKPTPQEVVDALKPLPTSKKPLYWTDQTDDGRSCWTTQPPELMAEVARVCGAVSVAGEHLTQKTWDAAVGVAKKYKLAISVNCWPWGWSRTPKDAKQEDATSGWVLQEYVAYKGWTQRVAAMASESKVSISAVLVDHERWRMNTIEGWSKIAKMHAIFKQAFPTAHQLGYANAQRVCDSKGWRYDNYGTDSASDIACCNWYTMGEYEEMRQRHMKTAFGRNSIVPWIAMGWHYRRGWYERKDRPIVYDSHCEHSAPSWNLYQAGCEMVKKDYDREPYITNSRIPCVILHPGPGANTEWYKSFVPFAYGTCEAILPEVWR